MTLFNYLINYLILSNTAKESSQMRITKPRPRSNHHDSPFSRSNDLNLMAPHTFRTPHSTATPLLRIAKKLGYTTFSDTIRCLLDRLLTDLNETKDGYEESLFYTLIKPVEEIPPFTATYYTNDEMLYITQLSHSILVYLYLWAESFPKRAKTEITHHILDIISIRRDIAKDFGTVGDDPALRECESEVNIITAISYLLSLNYCRMHLDKKSLRYKLNITKDGLEALNNLSLMDEHALRHKNREPFRGVKLT